MMFCVARCRRAGFTLIEIMIVIAIIAILAGIVVPSFVQARAEANLQRCSKNCETIANGLTAYLMRHSEKKLLDLMAGWAGGTVTRTSEHDANGYCYVNYPGYRDRWWTEYFPYYPDSKKNYCPTTWKGGYDGQYLFGYNWTKLHPKDKSNYVGWVVSCCGGWTYGYGYGPHRINGKPMVPRYALGVGVCYYEGEKF